MRRLVFLAVFAAGFGFAVTGCAKEVTREDPQADTHVDTNAGLKEVELAATDFKEKLAAFRFPDDAVQKYGSPMPCNMRKLKNDSDDHLNLAILEDRVRKVLGDTGKVVFTTTEGQEDVNAEFAANQQGDVKASEAVEGGQQAGFRYTIIGSFKSITKSDAHKGVNEHTMIFTLKFVDIQRRLTMFQSEKDFRLRKS